ncbi:MAG TPA: ATP-binding protein [Vicinamibacterales bacterium]|nr:ATP-binding protein [Vicinamibacterales bacterium]
MFRRTSRASRAVAYLIAVGVIGVCAELLFAIPAITPVAAAPILLLAVLLIARSFGTGPALMASVGAAIAFSFYFLPPAGLFIEDPNDWVAFGTFTITAIVVGELAARAEHRQMELEEGKREIEQLYQQLGSAFERASEAEAARRNEQLKSALLDALTHNLRTPLTAIKAAVSAMLSSGEIDVAALSVASRRELLLIIDEESDRLNRFIEGLSMADRPDPTQPNSFRAVAVDHVVREAVARAETVARRHRVVVAIAPNLPQLAVDRSAIGEALYTLIDNASKYSPVNTTIKVSGSLSGEHYVRLLVEDEGPGIAPELREQVFQKFFRIPGRESVDPRRTGIGLGLPIAKRLVESQAGQIAIETPASGRGTCVALTLPCAAPETQVEDPQARQPALRA